MSQLKQDLDNHIQGIGSPSAPFNREQPQLTKYKIIYEEHGSKYYQVTVIAKSKEEAEDKFYECDTEDDDDCIKDKTQTEIESIKEFDEEDEYV